MESKGDLFIHIVYTTGILEHNGSTLLHGMIGLVRISCKFNLKHFGGNLPNLFRLSVDFSLFMFPTAD